MINFIKKYKLQFALFIIIIIIIFLPYLLNKRIFLFNADQQLQYNYFYEEWLRLIKIFLRTGNLPFYSFNTFLGSNFYASKLYYLTGDIFLPFMLIASKFISDISTNLELFSVFYVMLSAVTFFIFLYSFGVRNKWRLFIGALLYSLSGIASNYVGQYMFHRFYSLLPLIFASIEYYRFSKKTYLFSLIVFIQILTSYYFMFPTTLYIIIYCLFTVFYKEKKVYLKDIFKYAYPLVIGYLIGVMLSAFLTLPGLLFLKDNQRIGQISFNLFYEFRVYLGYFQSMITAPLTLFSKYDYLFHVGYNGHLTWYSIYAGTAIIPFLFSLLFSRKREDRILRNFLIIINIFALLPITSSIFHGFSEPSFRWIFLVTFTHIFGFILVLEDFDKSSSNIFKGSLLFLLIYIVFLLVGFFKGDISIVDNPIHVKIIIFFICILGIYILLIKLNKKSIILILLACEIIFMFTIRLWILSETFYEYTPSLDENAIEYFHNIDDDLFYRIYVNPNTLLPTSTMNLNQSINMNFFSTTSYDSTYEYNLGTFLKLNNINWHIINLDNPEVLRMLGVKYYFVTEDLLLPKNFNWEYKYNINHYKVYELENHRSIGFTYSKFITEQTIVQSEFSWNSELLISKDLLNQVKSISEVDSSNMELIEFSNNRLVGNINVDSEQVLFFSIPYNTGWKVYIDNLKTQTYDVQGGFIGVIIEPGYHEIILQYTPPGFKLGVITTLLGLILYIFIFITELKNKQ